MKDKSAIIPYRKKKDKLEFLLIRNSTDTKWVIPKGTVERPLKPHISATKEAYEEAGVLGKPHPIKIGQYFKNDQKVPVFLLDVDVELKDYEEKKIRDRKWIDSSKISIYVIDVDLQKTLKRAVKIIQNKGDYFKFAILTFCEFNNLKLEEITTKKAIVKFPIKKNKQQKIQINRYKSTVEFLINSSIHYASLKDVSHRFANSFLQENAKNKIGFWCIRKEKKQYHFSRMYNTELELLNNKYFNKILESLSSARDGFQTAKQK